MHFVYILYSENADRYYIGSTKDIGSRIAGHNTGKTPYTRSRGPWELVYQEEYPNRSEAIQRESQIKRKKSRAFIKYLIESGS